MNVRRIVALLCLFSRGHSEAGPVPKVSVELADPRALERIVSPISVLDGSSPREQQSSAEQGTHDSIVRLLRNGNRDFNHWICASKHAELGFPLVPATFDRAECEESYVRGAVAARFTGSGEMVRFWMTALSMRFGRTNDEVLRVYVDDEPTPVVQATIASIADGSAGEVFAPPFGAGTSRYVSWRYPVVFAKKLIVAVDHLGMLDNYYHQTDVLWSERPRHRAPERLALRDVAKATLSAPGELDGTLLDEQRLLGPSSSQTFELAGSGTITSLAVLHPERLRDVRMVVEWDGIRTIDLPLPELFAAALDAPIGESLGLAAHDGWTALRLPMSFGDGAKITLTNNGESTADVAIRARGHRARVSRAHLFVERHEAVAPAADPLPLLKVEGAGRWVGTCAMMEGHAMSGFDLLADPLNCLEGDERVTIDGKLVIQGTGTEDYFDSAFYFLGGPRATPFAMSWGVTEDRTIKPSRGRATACRFHVGNDTIEFKNTIESTLEIGNGDPSLLDRYRTVAFYYR